MNGPYILGLFFIFAVSIIWSFASILVAWLYETQDFDSPFLLTYIGSSLFVVLIPMRLIWERRKKLSKYITNNSNDDELHSGSTHGHIIPWKSSSRNEVGISMRGRRRVSIPDLAESLSSSNLTTSKFEIRSRARSRSSSPIRLQDVERELDMEGECTRLTPSSPSSFSFDNDVSFSSPNYLLSHQDHIQMALKIAPLWFISNYSYNLSLKYTSITSSTVLSSTGSVFTFIFALSCGDEKFTKWKFLGVAMSFCGSLLTALNDANKSQDDDGSSNSNELWGDAAGLISAVGYGGYTLLVRILCPKDENRMSMQLFLGYVGLMNALFMSPFLFWSLGSAGGTSTGDDDVNQAYGNGDSYNASQKLTGFILLCLIVKGLLDNVLSDYLWARAIILTSATVATVGLGLTIPLALLSDIFVMERTDVISAGNIMGAFLVLIGFVFVNIGEGTDESAEETSLLAQQRNNQSEIV